MKQKNRLLAARTGHLARGFPLLLKASIEGSKKGARAAKQNLDDAKRKPIVLDWVRK